MTTILLVEDEPDIRLVVSLTLKSGGYDVIAVGTGEEGVERAAEADLLLLDLRLPGIDGFGVMEALADSGAPPIIVMSAHASQDTHQRALDRGAARFITKPFASAALLAAVQDVLEGQAAT